MADASSTATPLDEALSGIGVHYRNAALFSFVVGALGLAQVWFMLQVYDRVVTSRSVDTLLMLVLLVLVLFVLLEALDWVRAAVMRQAATRVDRHLDERLFNAIFQARLRRQVGGTPQALNDLNTLRGFLSSRAMMVVLGVPFVVVILGLIFMISPLMGAITLVVAILQIVVAALNEREVQPPLAEANQGAIDAQNYATGMLRNAQVIESMGMAANIHRRWREKQRRYIYLQGVASDHAATNNALSRFLQNLLSNSLLGLGAWFTISGDFPGGGSHMIVCYMLGARMLSPLVQLVAQWRHVVNGRDAYDRLNALLTRFPEREPGIPLPPPRGVVAAEGVFAVSPENSYPILRGVSFNLRAGEAMAVVGPSGSGKTTLARLLVGVWPAAGGKVRLDGADVHAWAKEELGPHLGYLSQGVELLEGTLAENIARFGPADEERVAEAGRIAGLDGWVGALPRGYDTLIGEDGCFLSGGQRQQVGLARAVYGRPRLLVLDEPNSSLDEAGEQALMLGLAELKAAGTTIVVITHRTTMLNLADKVLVLRDGQVQAWGSREEILAAAGKLPVALPESVAVVGDAEVLTIGGGVV